MQEYRVEWNLEQGAEHEKYGRPCEDSVMCLEMEDAVILADSDGHSQVQSFRADRGSKLACEAAVEVLMACLDKGDFLREELAACPDLILGQIERAVLALWNKKIAVDWMENPLTPEEDARIETDRHVEWRKQKGKPWFIRKAYGANLVFAVITRDFWFAAQNGDGSCIMAFPNGIYEKRIPQDEKNNMGQISSSLCDPDAADTFRHAYGTERLSAMFLCSDGLGDNSYEDTLHEIIYKIGVRAIQDDRSGMEALKAEINRKWRVKDDISFAAAFYGKEALPQPVLSEREIERHVEELTKTVKKAEKMELLRREEIEKHEARIAELQSELAAEMQRLEEAQRIPQEALDLEQQRSRLEQYRENAGKSRGVWAEWEDWKRAWSDREAGMVEIGQIFDRGM